MQALRVAQFLTQGYLNFGHRGFLQHQKSFTPNALDVDLTGKHYIVTGATSGLGRATALELARRGGSVHLVVRDGTRGEKVRSELSKTTGNKNVHTHVCDISSMADVARFADEWKRGGRNVAALVNNAGGMMHVVKQSREGVESNFATNTLGTFFLTEMLRPCLSGGRVVTVSSGGMLTEVLDVENLEGGDLVKGDAIDGAKQYARGKRHQVALTEHWARKYGKGVFWASMHPGWAGTPGLEKAMPGFFKATQGQLRSEEAGADTIVWLAVADEAVKYPSGEFFFDREPADKHLRLGGTGYKKEKVDQLVAKLEAVVKEKGFQLPREKF